MSGTGIVLRLCYLPTGDVQYGAVLCAYARATRSPVLTQRRVEELCVALELEYYDELPIRTRSVPPTPRPVLTSVASYATSGTDIAKSGTDVSVSPMPRAAQTPVSPTPRPVLTYVSPTPCPVLTYCMLLPGSSS
eukprot:560421-Rhodomonas_salina.1